MPELHDVRHREEVAEAVDRDAVVRVGSLLTRPGRDPIRGREDCEKETGSVSWPLDTEGEKRERHHMQ